MTLSKLRECTASLQINRQTYHEGAVAVSQIKGCSPIKLYVGVRPAAGLEVADQIREIYQKLDELLQQHGAGQHHVITEKVFFSDLEHQVETFRAIREEFYRRGNSRPATTYLQQPPCVPGVLCELQARVIIPTPDEEVEVRDLEGLLPPVTGKVVSYRGYHHLYLHNLTGGEPGDGRDFTAQMEEVFARAEAVLEGEGLTFRDVIRTWVYLTDIDRDYDELNRVRTAFFERQGVKQLPASTGIQGGVYPGGDRGGGMDLYALRTERPVPVKLMHAPTLNEAWDYGSSFSRGLTVTREDRIVAYVSGTASIDESGQVVHVGDIEGQVNRMLLNVEQLLAGSGATPADLTRATTYLKNRDHLECFSRVWHERGFPDNIPHTVCRADVCRPDWLCETEMVAFFPLPGAQPS